MSSDLLGFLTELATDPSAMSSCMKDPALAMKRAKLSQDQQTALLSRDTAKIHAAITGTPDPATTPLPQSPPIPQSPNAKMVADLVTSDPSVAQWLQSVLLPSIQSWGAQPGAATAPAAPGALPPEPQPDVDEESVGKAEGEEKKDG